MHYDIIIISNYKNEIDPNLFKNLKVLILDESHSLIDLYQTNSLDTFDFCIFSNLDSVKRIPIMIDSDIVITNCYFQTNYDHIFAIGPINHSKETIIEQIKIIIDFLNI